MRFRIMLDARKQRHGFPVNLVYTDARSRTQLLPSPIDLGLESISAIGYQWTKSIGTTIGYCMGGPDQAPSFTFPVVLPALVVADAAAQTEGKP